MRIKEVAFRIANSEFWSVSAKGWNMDFQEALEERIKHWEKKLRS